MENSLNLSTYLQLKMDILTFALKPGDTVSAAKIAARYGVSRTPAREALVRLETERLVDIIPQSKSVISKINLGLANQEWFIRTTLEKGMVSRFIKNVTDDDIKKMIECNERMRQIYNSSRNHENAYTYLKADNDFHRVCYKCAGQELAADVIRNSMAHYLRLRILTEMDDKYIERTLKGHEELIKFAQNRDEIAYTKSLEAHLGYIIKDIEVLEKTFPQYFCN